MVAGEKGLKTLEFSWITYADRLGESSFDDHGPSYLLWLGCTRAASGSKRKNAKKAAQSQKLGFFAQRLQKGE